MGESEKEGNPDSSPDGQFHPEIAVSPAKSRLSAYFLQSRWDSNSRITKYFGRWNSMGFRHFFKQEENLC